MVEGFKHTEVGFIPSDWVVKKIGQCLLKNPDYGINAAAVPYSEYLPVYLRITDITEDGNYSKKNLVSVNSISSASYYLQEGDLVFARTGASVGKTYLYNPKDGKLVFAGFLIRVRANEEVLLPNYLKYFTQTKQYWDWIATNSMRTGQPGINGNEYKELQIPLPPTKAEQTAIATALNDADALIAQLEKLIAKKRAIKQGAMQELLRPKEGWVVKKIQEFTDVCTGGTPSTLIKDYWGGEIRWMNSGELNLKKVYDVENRITEYGLKNSATRLIPENCILIGLAGQGKTRGTVAINKVELCTNQSIAAILPCDSIDFNFLYFNLDSRYDELRALSTGDSARGGLNLTILKNLSVSFPVSKTEQTRIATILSDMDSEIAIFEEKLEKYKMLKQGMMQQLLTGKIRLI